ncbi:MAG: FHA domain-containing protein [Chloroflexota bacterium]
MSVQLKITRGPRIGQEYQFDHDEITIGSGRSNDIVIMDNDVSTLHCRLMKIDRDYDIEDMRSKYGTFVNGQRITSEPFTMPGRAIIELGGQVTIEYRLMEKQAAAKPVDGIRMIENDPGSQPVLVQVEGDATIKDAFLLDGKEVSLGRSTDNDIIIQEIDISRKHLKLLWRHNRYYAQDLNSRNGTFVNGERLTRPVELHHSDVIMLGATVKLHMIFRSDLPKDWRKTDRLGRSNSASQETTVYKLPSAPGATSTRELPLLMEEGELADSIFMVYAREDWKDMVAPIVANLNDSKQQVWVEQHLRPGSKEWQSAIQQAQRECWLLVVVMSPAAERSAFVREQYRHFYNREKPIIMVNYKPVERLPIQLARVVRINYDEKQPGEMFQRLLFEIMHLKPRYNR